VVGDDHAEDALQVVRTKLFVGDGSRDGTPKIADYRGRGSLAGWVRVVAVRTALTLRRGARRAERREANDDALLDVPGALDVELDHLKTRYRGELQAALRRALSSLTARERNLLRMHFIEGLSVDDLGALHRVHRATAARWIVSIRERLFDAIREDLTHRLGIDRSEFDSLVALVRSQLDVSLHRFLAADDGASTP
jgi:RNA polymerase sigma-70 factor (ECF subfamily)